MGCWWFFHDWSEWGRPFRFGYNKYLRRTCSVCKLEEQKEVGWDDSHSIETEI